MMMAKSRAHATKVVLEDAKSKKFRMEGRRVGARHAASCARARRRHERPEEDLPDHTLRAREEGRGRGRVEVKLARGSFLFTV
jgi:hypothetical protein